MQANLIVPELLDALRDLILDPDDTDELVSIVGFGNASYEWKCRSAPHHQR
jgi:hypothetical protein